MNYVLNSKVFKLDKLNLFIPIKILKEKINRHNALVDPQNRKYDLIRIDLTDGSNICIDFTKDNKFNIYSQDGSLRFIDSKDYFPRFKAVRIKVKEGSKK